MIVSGKTQTEVVRALTPVLTIEKIRSMELPYGQRVGIKFDEEGSGGRNLLHTIEWLVNVGSWLGVTPFDLEESRETLSTAAPDASRRDPFATSVDFSRERGRTQSVIPKPSTIVVTNNLKRTLVVFLLVPLAYLIAVGALHIYEVNNIIASTPTLCRACRVVFLGMLMALPLGLATFSLGSLAMGAASFKKLFESMAVYTLKEEDCSRIMSGVAKRTLICTLLSLVSSVGTILALKHLSDDCGYSDSVRAIFYILPVWIVAIGMTVWCLCDAFLFAFEFTIYHAMEVLNGELEALLPSPAEDGSKIEAYSNLSRHSARDLVTSLSKIRVRYVKLCRMANDVAHCHSTHIFMALQCAMVVFIFSVALIAITMTEMKDTGDFVFDLYLAFHFLWQLGRIMLLCHVCSYPDDAVSSAQEILSLTDEMFHGRGGNGDTMSPTEVAVIPQFQDQLRIHNPLLTIHKGFFVLTKGVTLAILATFADYVVVSIEFQPMNERGGGFMNVPFIVLLQNITEPMSLLFGLD